MRGLKGVNSGQEDLDFPGKVSVYNAGDPGSIPGSGRSPGEGNGNPLQYSFRHSPSPAAPQTVAQINIWTSLVAQKVKRLSTMRETWVRSLGWEDPLEKEMAIHSRTTAWKIPRTEEPGSLQPMGSQRVGHD